MAGVFGNISIDENQNLSDVERFTYLKGYLFGEAASCIQGLPLTASNYQEALRLLEDRFGNRTLIIAKHMNALLDLERVESSTMVKELRNLLDKIVVNIRALNAYGISSQQFGPMLAPVLMKVLPNDIQLEVNRRLSNRDWSVDQLIDLLRAEVKTRETCALGRKNESRKSVPKRQQDKEKPSFTTESLAVGIDVI